MNTILKDLHPEQPEVYSDVPYDPPKTAEDSLAAQKGDVEQHLMDAAMNEPGKLQSVAEQPETAQKQEVSQAPQQTTSQPSYQERLKEKFQALGGIYQPENHADEVRKLERQKKISNLTDALLTLGSAYYGTKGYNIPAPQQNRTFQKSQQELKKLHDQMDIEAINARRINLSNRQRAAQMVANDDRAKAANEIRQRNIELIKGNQDIARKKAESDADYRKRLADAAEKRAHAEVDYRNKMAKVALQRAVTYDYNSKHHKGSKPYMSVDVGNGENKQYTKEQVTKIATDYLTDLQNNQDALFASPEFIQKLVQSQAPPSDAQAKQIVQWMFYPKQGGSGIPDDPNVIHTYGGEQTDPYGNPINKKPRYIH